MSANTTGRFNLDWIEDKFNQALTNRVKELNGENNTKQVTTKSFSLHMEISSIKRILNFCAAIRKGKANNGYEINLSLDDFYLIEEEAEKNYLPN